MCLEWKKIITGKCKFPGLMYREKWALKPCTHKLCTNYTEHVNMMYIVVTKTVNNVSKWKQSSTNKIQKINS